MIFLLVTALLLLAWLFSSPFYWLRRGVPYILPLPFVGNFLPAFYLSSKDFFDKIYYKFPNAPYVGIHFFSQPVLVLRDPQVIMEVLAEKSSFFRDRGFYGNHKRDPVSQSILFLTGDKWKAARTKLSPFFSPSKIKALVKIGERSFEKLLMDMDSKTLAEKNDRSVEKINMQDEIFFFTTDLTVRTFFGLESSVFADGTNSDFYSAAKGLNTSASLIKILIGMASKIIFNFVNLIIFTAKTNFFVNALLEASIKSRIKATGNTRVVIDGLLEMLSKNDIDKDFAMAHGTLLYSAAVQTTGLSIGFTLHELAQNLELQKELRSKLGTEGGHTLMKAVIQETLRKYPEFKMLNRVCTQTCQLSTGLVIEPGTMVLIPLTALHADPKHFPDPEEYRPGREMPKGAYLPFGAGPRNCLGMRMAMTLIEETLARLLEKYEFAPSDIPISLYRMTFFTSSRTGVWLKVRPTKRE